jgi:hypothetical protein
MEACRRYGSRPWLMYDQLRSLRAPEACDTLSSSIATNKRRVVGNKTIRI